MFSIKFDFVILPSIQISVELFRFWFSVASSTLVAYSVHVRHFIDVLIGKTCKYCRRKAHILIASPARSAVFNE